MNAITSDILNGAMCLSDVVHSGARVGEAKTGAKRFWTAREVKILKDNYATLGVAGCLALLPGRSTSSIYQQARLAGLVTGQVGQTAQVFRTQRWTSSDAIDAVIRREYLLRTHKGAVQEIAKVVGRPRWWVSKRAVSLGLTTTRRKEPAWTLEEEEFVAECAAMDPAAIARLLRAKGFRRTPTAVVVKLKRLGEAVGRNADPNHYTARALAEAMGVEHTTVRRWITQGLLFAEKRGTERVAAQGGDEWWISRKAVRKFIAENVQVIDVRKVEKHWFVDLLLDRSAA